MEGFLLIHTEVNRAAEVARHVETLDGLLTVEIVTGPYDLVARARWSCERELLRSLEEEIESIPGVTRVLACPLASETPLGATIGERPRLAVAVG